MAELLQPDLCIIGAGSAGLTVAAAARAFDASVVLIEKGQMGGDCLNTGCVPSKALIAAAEHAEMGRSGGPFGVHFDAPRIDFAQVHQHVRSVIDGIAPHDSVERFTALAVRVITAEAQFRDRGTVVAGDCEIKARRFVVAAGSHAAVPPIAGIEDVDYLTNETVFSLREAPAHLIIIGGGPIGIELAQAFVRLGTKVSVVERGKALSKDDPELTAIALTRVRRDGVRILEGTAINKVSKSGSGISLEIDGENGTEKLEGSHLLVAAGRAPNLSGLGLEQAGIRHDDKGIFVNKGLRTSNRRVFAIGDIVSGGLQFTHAGSYQAGLVVRSALFGLPAKQQKSLIPWATYTDPELANIGLTEEAARQKHGENFRVIRWPFAENDRARTDKREDGLVKLIADKKGRILGCGIVGTHAGELITLFSYAMANKMKVSSLLGFVAPYPTLAENAKRLGTEFYREKLDNPWIGRWLGFIRKLP